VSLTHESTRLVLVVSEICARGAVLEELETASLTPAA